MSDFSDSTGSFSRDGLTSPFGKIMPGFTPGDSKKADSSPATRHHKYLTNSELLHLQLKDPEMRIHFLTQLLIICYYLTSEIGVFVSGGSDGPASDRGRGALDDLAKLRKRAEELLRATPPHGTLHLRTVEWLLEEREVIWQKWKKNKCQPKIEKYAEKRAVDRVSVANNEEAKKKRRMHMPPPSGRGHAGAVSEQLSDPHSLASTEELYSYRIDIKKDLPSISKSLSSCVPDLDSYLEEYVEALDPEAGIEKEYHPRNDKAFSWRAMRLLARDHLSKFNLLQRRDGDFERVVRTIWKEDRGVDIPGKMPEPEELEGFDDEEKMEKRRGREETSGHGKNKAKQKEENGLGMDDASVGSPVSGRDQEMEEVDENKNARMKEYAKVADDLENDLLQQEDEQGKGPSKSSQTMIKAEVEQTLRKHDEKSEERENLSRQRKGKDESSITKDDDLTKVKGGHNSMNNQQRDIKAASKGSVVKKEETQNSKSQGNEAKEESSKKEDRQENDRGARVKEKGSKEDLERTRKDTSRGPDRGQRSSDERRRDEKSTSINRGSRHSDERSRSADRGARSKEERQRSGERDPKVKEESGKEDNGKGPNRSSRHKGESGQTKKRGQNRSPQAEVKADPHPPEDQEKQQRQDPVGDSSRGKKSNEPPPPVPIIEVRERSSKGGKERDRSNGGSSRRSPEHGGGRDSSRNEDRRGDKRDEPWRGRRGGGGGRKRR